MISMAKNLYGFKPLLHSRWKRSGSLIDCSLVWGGMFALWFQVNQIIRLYTVQQEFYASQIIQSGVKVFLYQNGFLHAKTMIVDGELVTVGTSNFDMRSFRLNFEVNAFIYNEEVAGQVETDFLKDLHNCTIATKDYFDKQSRWKKFKQRFHAYSPRFC